MAVTKKLRFEVFKRDSFRCVYCGQSPPNVILEVDHVVPTSKGGKDCEGNLVCSCFDCNRGKSDVSLGSIVPGFDQRLAVEMEKREQLRRYNAYLKKLAKEEAEDLLTIERHWFDFAHPGEDGWKLTEPSRRSLRTFYKRLPKQRILEAIEAAFRAPKRDPFGYFCGVCWKMIKEGK